MKTYILICTLLSLFLSSCVKKEYMPEPVGHKIPYHESKTTVQETLNKSAYTFFSAAWKRSHMDKILNDLNSKVSITVFVPDNQSFEKMGYSLASINSTAPEVLDSLLLFHTCLNQIIPATLDKESTNQLLLTMLSNKNYTEAFGLNTSEFRDYLYRHYLNVENDKVLVNGQVSGSAGDVILATNGTLIPIHRVLAKPEKDIKEILEQDGRFKLYLSFLESNDEFYLSLSGFPANQVERFSSKLGYVTFSSVLAPTDEAFHKAGIYSMDDLDKLNSRSTPYIIEDGFTVSNYLPMDSVLNNHFWQFSGVYVRNVNERVPGQYINPSSNALVFFSNDMKDQLIGNYVTLYDTYWDRPIHENNLEFIRNGEEIKIRVKGSDAEPATVISRDIQAFNGTIHVLNRLLLPKGFKF